MSVTIKYNGESGSHISQYCAARLFCIKNNFQLRSSFGEVKIKDRWGNELRTNALVDVHHEAVYLCGYPLHGSPVIKVDDGNFHSMMFASQPLAYYEFDGNFAFSEFFERHRDQIENFIKIDETPPADPEDIGLHLRAGGFSYAFSGGSKIIHPGWHYDILRQLEFRHCYVHTDEPGHPCVREIMNFFPGRMKMVPIELGARHAFNSLASFDRVIAGNSTFSFFASFLGRASMPGGKVWTLKEQLGGDHPNHQLGRYRNSIEVSGSFWSPS